ncbi:hypothetical protein C0991_007686 [Blastosporella zonata]|nr:hypothetical protein C0991_007686 [Blastosporella zonata]
MIQCYKAVQNHIGPAVELYYASFGQHANFEEIGKTISSLAYSILEAQVATYQIGPESRIIAAVNWVEEGGKWYPSLVRITGDNVSTDWKIIRPDDDVSKPRKEVNQDLDFVQVRESVTNMHDNAESYA